MPSQRTPYFTFLLAVLVFAGCDSGETGSAQPDTGDEDPFEDVGPGTRIDGITGDVQIVTWSDDSAYLYLAAIEPILENNVYVGTRYRLYEADGGGSSRLLYEGTTSASSTVRSVIPDLEEARGALFFYTDAGSIYRKEIGSDDEPERLVEGATIPNRGNRDPFSVSGDASRLAYYAEGAGEDAYEVRIVDLGTSAETVAAVGTADHFTSYEHTPVILSDDGSRLLHKLRMDQGEGDATKYAIVEIESGSERRFTVGSLGGRFYSEDASFIAAYVAASGRSREIVVHHLPDGVPEPVAPFQETVGTTRFGAGNWRAQTISSTAVAPNAYAFWLKGVTEAGQVCAVHGIDLTSGQERRLAGPIPEREASLYCGINSDAFSFAPDGSRLAYYAPSSGDVYVAATDP